MENKKGILIAFEGTEGCGKTTQSKLFYEELIRKNIPAVLTKEPGGVDSTKQIREILLERNDLDAITELFLFLADRREHFLKMIFPELRQGKVVITDRASASTWAYQYYGKEIYDAIYPFNLFDFIFNADFLARSGRIINMNILFDGPVEVGLERVKKSRKILTSFEQRDLEFHERVKCGFLKQAKENPERFAVFDFTKPIDELSKEIFEYLNSKFYFI